MYSNHYLQTETKAKKGCQIDYLVQTKFNVLYVCEIKFSKNEIGSHVIDEVEEKIQRLKMPRGYSVRPVLVHVNGVSSGIIDRDYFASIIDFSALL